tara:strand:+ start:58 stop:1074 length:1017 start_codon:yes stop_codon:yes gene_type:complete
MPINVTDEKGKIIAGPKKGGDDTEREKGLKKSKMLIGGQAKLDKNKNNRIDSEDFELLRAGKKRGGVMKAKRGKLSRLRKLAKAKGLPAPLMADPKFKFKSAGKLPAASAGGRGGGKGPRGMSKIPNAQEFLKRRMMLAGVKSALPAVGKRKALGMLKGPAKAGALLGVALAVPVGKMLKKVQDKRKAKTRDKAKVKKMGGGLAAATERLKAQGKMGGGMMKPQKAVLGKLFRKKGKATPGMKMVESSPGGFGLLGRLAKKVGLQKGGGADMGKYSLSRRDVKILGKKGTEKLMERREKLSKKMGGGMMQPAMPMYKKGTMIKARGGGLAKTKPTKMY